MKRLMPPVVRSNLPSTAEVTLRKREGSVVMHVLNCVPMKRCKAIETIEDVAPLYGAKIEVRCGCPPKSAALVPSRSALKFTHRDG